MTIASLLGHFGVRVPRYVTVDGQIVHHGVLHCAQGHRHPALGAVTAVTPHAFHGGVQVLTPPTRTDNPQHDQDNRTGIDPETTASGAPSRTTNWFEDSTAVRRHGDAMAACLPGFQLIDHCSRPPAWIGTINTGRGHFDVLIRTRRDEGLPIVEPVRPHHLGKNRNGLWVPSPHTFTNGNLCVADAADWDPTKHTVATAALWAAHWYAAYTEWRMSDRWPQDGYLPR